MTERGAPPPADPTPAEEASGLPWPRTWRGVYAFVLGAFAVWLFLLALLSAAYR